MNKLKIAFILGLITVNPNSSFSQTPLVMNIDDFLLDVKGLSDQIVAVKGNAMCMGADMCSLNGDNLSTSFLFDGSNLSREDRKRLMNCNPIVRPCRVTLVGKAKSGFTMISLEATSIVWSK